MTDTAGGSTSAPAGDAAIPASPAPNIVHLRCRCVGVTHEFDTVTLFREATIPLGIAFSAAMKYADDLPSVEAALGMVYLRHGIAAWSFRDTVNDEVVPVAFSRPIDPDLLERWLPFADGGLTVIEAADDLYGQVVLRPLVARRSPSSPSGHGGASTSQKNGSGRKHPKHSKRSSPTTTDGERSDA